jgi:glutathione S-transferase
MTIELITFPLSHFCEKARWALDRAGIDHTEVGHLPMLQIPAVRRAGGARQVPVLVSDGAGVPDSTAILHWIDQRVDKSKRLFPEEPALRREVEEWEERFDKTLGPAARRIAYLHLLPEAARLQRYLVFALPRWEKKLFAIYRPLLALIIRKALRVTAANAARDEEKLRALFEEVAARLADGRHYLVGDRFTAADLTFASLGAPLLQPANYGVPLPPLDELPAGLRERVLHYRETPAGKFLLRLYQQERGISRLRQTVRAA